MENGRVGNGKMEEWEMEEWEMEEWEIGKWKSGKWKTGERKKTTSKMGGKLAWEKKTPRVGRKCFLSVCLFTLSICSKIRIANSSRIHPNFICVSASVTSYITLTWHLVMTKTKAKAKTMTKTKCSTKIFHHKLSTSIITNLCSLLYLVFFWMMTSPNSIWSNTIICLEK